MEKGDGEVIKSQSEKDIFEGCKSLMETLVKYFEYWCECIGVECEKDEMFSVSMPTSQIVRDLFLFKTNHSGMTSTIEKCKELGLDYSERVRFSIDLDESEE